jgi:hypothetical protein
MSSFHHSSEQLNGLVPNIAWNWNRLSSAGNNFVLSCRMIDLPSARNASGEAKACMIVAARVGAIGLHAATPDANRERSKAIRNGDGHRREALKRK